MTIDKAPNFSQTLSSELILSIDQRSIVFGCLGDAFAKFQVFGGDVVDKLV